MTIETFVRKCNLVVLALSLLFLLDTALPYTIHNGSITGTHRPIVSVRYGKATYSPDQVIIETTDGQIKVRPNYLEKITAGDGMILYKTFFFGISKKIFLQKRNRDFAAVNLLFGYFRFFPYLIVVLSLLTVRTSNRETLLNIGVTNILLSSFSLILLVKDYIELSP